MMDNRQLARRRVELINAKNFEALPEVLSSDVVTHFGTSEEAHGVDELAALVEGFEGLPDVHATIDAVVSEGDLVATRYTARGTHSGGILGVEPTGSKVVFEGSGLHRVDGGRIVESWVLDDLSTLMRQITSDAVARPPAAAAASSAGTGDVEANKELIRQWIALANARDFDALRDLWADDLVLHAGADLEDVKGFDSFRGLLGSFYAGFPDLEITIDELIGENDEVFIRARTRGTYTGDYMGIPAHGQRVEFVGLDTYRIENGRIAEEWFNDDLFTLMTQLEAG